MPLTSKKSLNNPYGIRSLADFKKLTTSQKANFLYLYAENAQWDDYYDEKSDCQLEEAFRVLRLS